MSKFNISEFKTDSKDWLLQTCFDRFGTLQKTDYESVLFQVLMINGYGDKTDFELSRLLKISETRVRNLKYKCSLEYPINEDYEQQLRDILNNANYKFDGNRIQFCIPDKMLRLYINALLEADGNFTDSSFNSSIVSITPMDMVDLMIKLCGAEKNEDYEELRKHISNSTSQSLKEFPKSKSERFRDGIIEFARVVTKSVAPRFAEPLVDSIAEQIRKHLG